MRRFFGHCCFIGHWSFFSHCLLCIETFSAIAWNWIHWVAKIFRPLFDLLVSTVVDHDLLGPCWFGKLFDWIACALKSVQPLGIIVSQPIYAKRFCQVNINSWNYCKSLKCNLLKHFGLLNIWAFAPSLYIVEMNKLIDLRLTEA